MQYTFANTPIYSTQGNMTLIGVIHIGHWKGNQRKKSRFLRTILAADHLILEGNSQANEIQINTLHTKTYETEAYKKFKGPKHFLEENANHVNLYAIYGIEPPIQGVLEIFQILPALLQKVTESSSLFDQVQDYLEQQKRFYPGREEINIQRVIKLLKRYFNESPDLEALLTLGLKYKDFKKEIRDYRIFGPNIINFDSELIGKKVAIMGAAHIEYVKRVLQGQQMPPPTRWEDRSFNSIERRLLNSLDYPLLN